MERTGLNRASIYITSQMRTAPPVKIDERSAAWRETEIETVNAARIAGMAEHEIVELALKLRKLRAEAGRV